MRKTFFKELFNYMVKDKNIYMLTGDLGYGGIDKIKKYLPDQFINCGASEQSMLDIAVGLSYSGKTPICYSITPFLIYRGFETIRTYIVHEKLPIILSGSGRDNDYSHDGYSHNASDIPDVLEALQGIKTYYPNNAESIEVIFKWFFEKPIPTFISLKR